MKLMTPKTAVGFPLKCLGGALIAMSFASASSAQTGPAEEQPIEDVVVSEGTRNLGRHDGMDAFFNGDFETAEIEFEREFKSLRRFRSAQENAAFDADISADRAAAVSDFGANVVSSANSQGGAAANGVGGASPVGSAYSVDFKNKRSEGVSILTDGKITYEDFAFTRYMTGLSEIKLGKFEEAEASIKSSLFYDDSNYDARKRLGMLRLLDNDFEGAAKHLEKLDKLRRRCEKKDCEDKTRINQAALDLVEQINAAAQASN